VPTVLLVFGAAVALLTLAGLVSVRHWAILFPAFFVSFLGVGMAGWWAVLVPAVAVLLVALGGLASWAGWVGLAFVGVALVGIGYEIVLSRRASREFDRVLAERVQERHQSRRRPRSVLLPWSMRDAEVERTKDIRYAEGAGARHLLDVYRARAPKTSPSPVLFQIHGGGWTVGTKNTQGRPLMNHFARAGWVCVAANYRLSPRARWPEHLVDCKAALAWIREHIHEYGGDPNRVVVTGGSAGGHLAAMIALTQNDPAYQPGFADVDTSVVAAIPMYGAYDLVETFTSFRSRLGRRVAGWVGGLVLGVTPDRDPGAFIDASPMAHIDAAVVRDFPFLVVHGTVDNLVPVEQARKFTARLREAGADVTYVELHGAPHAFDVFHSTWEHASTTGIEWWLSVVVPTTVPEARPKDAPISAGGRGAGTASARSAAGASAASDPTTMARTAPS
jgi:acetyl esterase/lipase